MIIFSMTTNVIYAKYFLLEISDITVSNAKIMISVMIAIDKREVDIKSTISFRE